MPACSCQAPDSSPGKCSHCYGTGNCSKCHGIPNRKECKVCNGKLICNWCRGGVCPDCNGACEPAPDTSPNLMKT